MPTRTCVRGAAFFACDLALASAGIDSVSAARTSRASVLVRCKIGLRGWGPGERRARRTRRERDDAAELPNRAPRPRLRSSNGWPGYMHRMLHTAADTSDPYAGHADQYRPLG